MMTSVTSLPEIVFTGANRRLTTRISGRGPIRTGGLHETPGSRSGRSCGAFDHHRPAHRDRASAKLLRLICAAEKRRFPAGSDAVGVDAMGHGRMDRESAYERARAIVLRSP